jgi:DNA-binding transcriptional ArsR family regulator
MNKFKRKPVATIASERPSPAIVWITQPAQIRALESPMRQEIVDAITAIGPCSMIDLAEHLGKAPDALYFHVKKLVRVGLVQEIDKGRSGRHVWARYAMAGRAARIKYGPAQRQSIGRVIAGALRLSLRDFQRGFEQPGVRWEGKRRNLWGGRLKGWVSEQDLADVNRLLERLAQIMHRNGPGEGRQIHSLAWVLAPAQVRTRIKNAENKEQAT